jgi:hypothetical protein
MEAIFRVYYVARLQRTIFGGRLPGAARTAGACPGLGMFRAFSASAASRPGMRGACIREGRKAWSDATKRNIGVSFVVLMGLFSIRIAQWTCVFIVQVSKEV